jgi:hypothetical protein
VRRGLHRRGQRALHGVEDELMHGARVAETHLGLGRCTLTSTSAGSMLRNRQTAGWRLPCSTSR